MEYKIHSVEELDKVRREWKPEQWDSHFDNLGINSAGDARYSGGSRNNVPKNNVLKLILAEVNNYKCWYQGGQCRSRALMLREMQIDHVIPKECSPSALKKALKESSIQQEYFDVHDPGNLAIICGPCNMERPKEPNFSSPLVDRLLKSENERKSVIKKVVNWHKKTKISKAALEALRDANTEDNDTWEILSEIMAELILRKSGPPYNVMSRGYTKVSSEDYQFELYPSDELIDYYVGRMEDDRFEEMRIDSYLESNDL